MRLITSILIILLMASCAQVVPLSGGEKDIYAPTIDSSKTYPLSGTTHFSGDEIVIKFNEYIKLKNPSDNIIITPQLKEKPAISVKNKTFKLKFNQSLEQNTTYVINFNGAIQDITERNDSIFQFVFSTGGYIDSLSVSGKVTDAYTNLPQKKVLVAVYPTRNCKGVVFDSIPYKVKPTYFSSTNEKGWYSINYLKPDNYYIFAITDNNKNLLFDADDEKIGFILHPLSLTNSIDSIDFRLFSVQSPITKLKTTSFDYPGKLTLVFSNPPQQFKIYSSVNLLEENTTKKDSLIFWTETSPSRSMEFYYQLNNTDMDTIKPVYHLPKQLNKNLKLFFNLKMGKLEPKQNLVITTSEPIQQIDTSKIHFFNADSNVVSVEFKKKDLFNVEFYTFNSTATYFTIDSLAISSIYNHFNINKIKKPIKNYEADEYFGTINITLDSLPNNHFIVELLDSKNNVVEVVYIDSAQTTITFNEIPAGTYKLRMIKDDNQDKKWTSGSLIEKRQAEKVYYLQERIKLRSKWTSEIVWTIKP